MEKISFMNPEFFWLLLLIPALSAWHIYHKRKARADFHISNLSGVPARRTFWERFEPMLFAFQMLALGLLVVALARPRTVDVSSRTKTTRGIDIIMAVDVSGSMLARDFRPNRMEALKKVALDFASNRPNDRIGIVVYAAEAYTRTPVTSDQAVVERALKDIKYDRVLQDGTGIGMGLATAINRLKDSKAKSKVIILMTDGVNNAGFIEPETASDIAREFGIKVYTIGIGTKGMAEFPYAYAPNGGFLFKMMPVEIDEALMRSIAKKTGGKYFRATGNTSLESIYDEINKLETTEIEELRFYDYQEHFRPFALVAFGLIGFVVLLKQTVYRSFI